MIQLSTASFTPGGNIPKKFTCSGADVSPELSWAAPPPGTKSIALIVDDPDAPAGTWNHWLLYNLPPSVHELPENQPRTADWRAARSKARTISARSAITARALHQVNHTATSSACTRWTRNSI